MTRYDLLKKEMLGELHNILNFWSDNTVDEAYGGFVGRISHRNAVIPEASKGIILNSRILWSFSAASNFLKTVEYTAYCNRAYSYLNNYFRDNDHGGVFWEVDFKGYPLNQRKQVYAQAFTIYALSEYHVLTGNEEARNWAIELFELLEAKAHDKNELGYVEAFDRQWNPIEDMRLSDKDMNAAKTMNTHLHVLEAYAGLLRIYENDALKKALNELIETFQTKFLNSQYHYDLFFDHSWKQLSHAVSYGHNIETSWLLLDAANQLDDGDLTNRLKQSAVAVADRFLAEGIDGEGAVMNEKTGSGKLDTDRHWWPQVEALVGLKYAYEITSDEKYVQASLRIWSFVKEYLLDKEHGEWYFRVDRSGIPYSEEDKVSMWKAPYHTSRACILMNS